MDTRTERIAKIFKEAQERIAQFAASNYDDERRLRMEKVNAIGKYFGDLLKETNNPGEWANIGSTERVQHLGTQTLNLVDTTRKALQEIEFFSHPVTYIDKGSRFSTERLKSNREVPWLVDLNEKLIRVLNYTLACSEFLEGKRDIVTATPKEVAASLKSIVASVKECERFMQILVTLGLYTRKDIDRGIRCLSNLCRVAYNVKGVLYFKHRQCLDKIKAIRKGK